MDGMYSECAVKRAGSPKIIALRILAIAAVIATFFFSSVTGSKLLLVLGIIIACLVIWFWPMFNIEWEYIFVDGQLDFDTIAGGERRKTRLRIDFEGLEVLAPLGSHELDQYKNLKLRDYTSLKKDARVYCIVVKVGEEGLCRINFEPSDDMLKMMKAKSSRKVFIQAED